MIAIGIPPTIESHIQVASIGIPDTMLLMVLALIVFGPRRLPEIGRQIGKLMYEFRKVSNEFKYQMEEELRANEESERQKKLAAASVVTQEVPQPVQFSAGADTVPVSEEALEAGGTGSGATLAIDPSAVSEAPVAGEVRGEPRKFPMIQPPTTGEIVSAQKPFRGRIAEGTTEALSASSPAEIVTESGDAPVHPAAASLDVQDAGRIGTEEQPGVSVPERVAEREANHV